jgi:hypothetical protein
LTVGYYQRGYYRSQAGDYYRARGDLASILGGIKKYGGGALDVFNAISGGMPNLSQPQMQFSPTDLGMLTPGSTTTLGAPTVRGGTSGGRMVSFGRRSRRMNPGNFRALKRSMRRLKSFERAARQVYHFVKPAKGHSHFKVGRKRRR